ncbi:MAG: hypothetical protein Q8N43_03410 [Candidatus Azambacteria bacterium]|nr:hypothetical protein [Candidatus Azambacteria bacterium]
MPLAEKLQQKKGALQEKLSKKSQEAEKGKGAEIDGAEWLLLFLGAGYIDILFILLTIFGLIPIVGQVIYVIADPIINIIAAGIFWFYLQHKGLGHYWWLAFGGGVANLIPVVNWFGWITSVLILYFLVKAEKVPLAGEAIETAAKAASKIK